MQQPQRQRYQCGPISLELPAGWLDTTEDNGPFTLAREDGVGALQFSVATYRSGAIPDPSPEALRDMLLEFAGQHNLGDPRSIASCAHPVRLAAASFDLRPDDFVRAWYLSDGLSIARITYVCNVNDLATTSELEQAEEVVKSIRFVGGQG